ncbi:MAG TPA: sarcosine oxidase subunit alpha family protein [Candidatus Sulfotelmatobacter sp.]|nr:sarcosine oxidase subunit alpha family protein [Candidatus Sulfotelmatobacter sp.]
MSQPFRLPRGGAIDRGTVLHFRFDGRALEGHPGDTLASALLANGIHLVGRSFKYHRPRGILSTGAEEPNALVQIGTGARTTPNVRATELALFDGLGATSQNCWPSVGFDLGRINDRIAPLIPAGFYYKTFFGPPRLWLLYEHFIRRAAGLGRGPRTRDPDRYDQRYAHCDVLVVGGGPAGIAAAIAAGRTGARVILVDDQPELGGALLAEDAASAQAPALAWIDAARRALADLPELLRLCRTRVVGYYDGNFLTALETPPIGAATRERLWKIRAGQVVLATGAIERPLVFPDNDRPGIMLAGAVRRYLNRYGVLAGRRVALLANNDGAYRTALDLAAVGASVVAIDVRSAPTGALVATARARDIEVIDGASIVATAGERRVRRIVVARLDGGGGRRDLEVDLVAMSGGWMPTVHLFSQSRGSLVFDPALASFVPGRAAQPTRAAGACNGAVRLEDCLAQGLAAGAAAARDAGFGDGVPPPTPPIPEPEAAPSGTRWILPGRGKRFVDFQNDVTASDVALAAREGYGAVEHLKRYTTLGMGTDQGKTSNLAALAILSDLEGREIPAAGHTTFRPPYTPVTFGAIAGATAGALFAAARTTPIQPWHVAAGAAFEDVGAWKRPRYFPRTGETMQDAVDRECRAARSAVAMIDASTLGKIDIQGPDAATFLDRIYTNSFSTLGTGRCRYGLMLNENGMVFDDGVTTRLAGDHFHMTTTTGGAATVLDWLEEWLQTEWTDLAVHCTEVTEQWAVVGLSGRASRALLAPLTDIDLDPARFPFMALREGTVAGIPARVFRIGFSGALSYEVNVPARYGLALWEALHAAGQAHGIVPYGTEAMHVLRAEMGFIIVGQETDGTVTPDDLGLHRMVSKTKDFLGRRSLTRSDTARADRKQLVGLLTEDPRVVLPEGAGVTAAPVRRPPAPMLGHVTSSYHSANLGRSIALALVQGGRARIGDRLYVPAMDGTGHRVAVVQPTFVAKDAADG